MSGLLHLDTDWFRSVMWKCVLVLALLGCAMATGLPDSYTYNYGVTFDEVKGYNITTTPDVDCAAFAYFEDMLDEIGWMPIRVTTNGDYNDTVQMEAAGYLEGYLYQERIFTHQQNLWDWYLFDYVPGHVFPDSLFTYLQENLDFIRHNVETKPNDDYWRGVGHVLHQFDGVVLGYQAAMPEDGSQYQSELDLWMYQSAGDLLDLVVAVEPSMRPDWSNMTPFEKDMRFAKDSHCTGLVKLAGDYSDVYVSQAAWFFYGAMTRAIKRYTYNLHDPAVKAHSMAFSSYPGFLYSFDDILATEDQGMMALETTNDIFKTELYDNCSPESVLTWIRSTVAMRGSSSGQEWVDIFKRYNSGSYNNQWQVIDTKRLLPGVGAQPGLLTVLEQIPGYTHDADLTDVLVEQTYFPSFNIPYFTDIFDMSGYAEEAADDFTWSYEDNPRAQIFRRDAPGVKTFDDFKTIMRYNKWQTDELSFGDSGNAPASRYDLREDAAHRMGFGALDAKCTSKNKITEGIAFEAISSPTYDDQVPMTFGELYSPHRGLMEGPYTHPWITWEW
ncbi:phospholipase B-like protein [Kipferlia bialata]|uniref:Phospholipase B-like n=1 Tax=Kipferlia bialata TaxID=797122 RepID=A0A9K3CRZ4_9EUKA|nr:phospholipase B-like protein [Kipferlia bialata]|eukprot:g2264.t1